MKAKKPLLLAVLILALLTVALIVPAVATGKCDNKPVVWLSLGGKNFPAPGVINLQRAHLEWYGGDDISGHLILETIQPLAARKTITGHDFQHVSHTENELKFTAEFDLTLPGGVILLANMPAECTYIDGPGPGPAGDWWDIAGLPGFPVPFGGYLEPGNGNIVIQVNE